MLSLLSNEGSMSARQGLASLNQKMDTTRAQIASGLKVQSARDNGAAYAIATRVKSDQMSQGVVQNNLSRAQSIVDVARGSAETITDLLGQMHERAPMLNDTSLSPEALQSVRDDLNALNSQLDSTAKTSDFNGINLLQTSGKATKNWGRPYGGIVGGGSSYVNYDAGNGAGRMDFYLNLHNVNSANVNIDWGDGSQYTFNYSSGPAFTDNKVIQHDYEAGWDNHTMTYSISASGPGGAGGTSGFHIPGVNFIPADTTEITAYASGETVSMTHKPMGSADLGLNDLNSLDAATVLSTVEAALSTTLDSAAYFGTLQNRLERMSASSVKRADVLETAHGDLVDADLAKQSALWQADQTQQSLIQQSLAIANSAPRVLLQLFN
ncbi:flagellin [Asticcacaulis benevestitus]|uniref:Flagellin n=1 Tax=Asticcacaulis benevestitus DSM 16100 = ATCC BAA-896 TaxID=1121022 RepID=V4RM81_9CAUL|nr:flagellin [Asticcacaulis benevestitus]ESQ92388.1 hypothetical protein ABENE_08405 [Asticcacaulis benevestitus DSM 16100 = ATCC BAA-896]